MTDIMRRSIPLDVALWMMLSVILLVSGAWMSWRADYEDAVFQRIATQALENASIEGEEPVLGLLHAAHNLVGPRFAVFRGEPHVNLFDGLLRTPLHDLIDGRGACGSYSAVLARLLQVSGYPFRLVQMHCSYQRGCHILVEARIEKGWAVLDAMYDLSFERPQGGLASIEEVSAAWDDLYVLQVPEGYPREYDFGEYDYTNWQKIPLAMPAIRGVIRWFIGDEVDKISLRAFVIDRGRVLSRVFLTFGFIFGALAVFRAVGKRVDRNAEVRDA